MGMVAVVMIGAFAYLSLTKEYPVEGLCDRYRLIALDMRGHGCGPALADRGYDLRLIQDYPGAS
jgi:hypothetical protein